MNHILFSGLARCCDFLQELGTEWMLPIEVNHMILVWVYVRRWIKNICATNLSSYHLIDSKYFLLIPQYQVEFPITSSALVD